MDNQELRTMLDGIFDDVLVFHAFTDYMRDYELVVVSHSDQATSDSRRILRYLFKYCVEANVTTALSPEIWRASLDDRLTDTDFGDAVGHVWGVKWQCLYPGATIVEDSPNAESWAGQIGIEFHEVRIEANDHILSLVFSDLEVSEVGDGYVPFSA